MNSKFKPWDTVQFGKTELIILAVKQHRLLKFLEEDMLCYFTYDLLKKKVRVFSVLGIDRKSDYLANKISNR